MPRLTRLQELPRDRVALELDGHPWRVVSATAVVRAGLREGVELEREALRAFRRELRRAEALEIAGRVLSRRDAARAEIAARLERRGVLGPVREEALDRLAELGAVDDGRFARARAEQLADRGYGDAAIAFDLEQRGVPASETAAACAALAPEAERAAVVVAKQGRGARTAALLARRGFDEDAVALARSELDD